MRLQVAFKFHLTQLVNSVWQISKASCRELLFQKRSLHLTGFFNETIRFRFLACSVNLIILICSTADGRLENQLIHMLFRVTSFNLLSTHRSISGLCSTGLHLIHLIQFIHFTLQSRQSEVTHTKKGVLIVLLIRSIR